MYAHCALLCALLILQCAPSHSSNWFEGAFQGAKCFDSTWEKPDGCDETLWDVFEPKFALPKQEEDPEYEGQAVRRGGETPSTNLFLFTNATQDTPEFMHMCGGLPAPDTAFNPKRQTVIIVHGWPDGVCRSAWMREYKDEILRREDTNVILADWTWGNSFDPGLATENTWIVGQQLAYVVNQLVLLYQLDINYLHIIGHNLGAHAAGVAGRLIQEQCGNGNRIARITGLDPGFPDRDELFRLDPSDAQYVDIVQTSGGFCPTQILLLDQRYPLGHAEYFVNGGNTFGQLSCVPYIVVSLLKFDWFYEKISMTPWTCANLQAIQYYKSTIFPEDNPMVAVECDSWDAFSGGSCRDCGDDGNKCSIFGYDSPLTVGLVNDEDTKKYYLETDLICPYVKNDGIDLTNFKYGKFIEGGKGGSGGGYSGCFLSNILNRTIETASNIFGGIGGGLGGVAGASGAGAVAGSLGGARGGLGGGGGIGGVFGGGGGKGGGSKRGGKGGGGSSSASGSSSYSYSCDSEGKCTSSASGSASGAGSEYGGGEGGGEDGGDGGGDIISTIVETAQGVLGGGGGGGVGGVLGGGGGGGGGGVGGVLGGGGGGGGGGKGRGKKKGGGGLGGVFG